MFKVKDLQFQYPKNTSNTINGIDFDIAKGEIFGFLGPSGAGKTTTQKLMVKLLSNYKGYIEFDGKDLSKFHDEFYEDIGVCFEMPISFSKLTAMENLDFFRKLYKRQVDVQPLMERLGLWEDKDKLVEVDSPRNLKLKYGKRTVAVEYRNNGDVVKEVFTMDQIREQAFMDLIASKNIETIHSGETTLEEIFIQVTGVKLHGED